MKVCPFCKRTLLAQESVCSSCGNKVKPAPSYKKNGNKKRGFNRVPLKRKIKFQALSLDPQGKELSLEGRVDNISLSGICFDIDSHKLAHRLSYLRVSNLLWMAFSLPGKKEPFRFQGEIKRVRPLPDGILRIGVMFINLERTDYRIINDFVRSE